MLVHRLLDVHLPEMLPVRDAAPILGVSEGSVRLLPTSSEYDYAKQLENNGCLRGVVCRGGSPANRPPLQALLLAQEVPGGLVLLLQTDEVKREQAVWRPRRVYRGVEARVLGSHG